MGRERPNKKWTDAEIIKLLDYMHETSGFEASSAQPYYQNCIEVTGINATPNVLRWKVRHLRLKYEKAKEWRNSLDVSQELDLGVERIKEKLQQMCPHYNRLDLVFGSTSAESVDQTTGIEIKNEKIEEEDEEFVFMSSPEYEFSSFSPFPPASKMVRNQEISENVVEEDGSLISEPTSVEFQSEQLKLQKMQIEFNKLKHEERKLMQAELIKFQRQKFEAEMDLKRKEIDIKQEELRYKFSALDRDELLRKLEIEKDERVAKCEIYIKYNINNIKKFACD